MGWRFPWVSSLPTDFNYDFGVAFTEDQQQHGAEYNFRHVDKPSPQREGVSAFVLLDGVVHRWVAARTTCRSRRAGGAATTSTRCLEQPRSARSSS